MSPGADPAHDLKNQLSIILGFTELLVNGLGEGEDQRRMDLDEIKAAAEQALVLVTELSRRVEAAPEKS